MSLCRLVGVDCCVKLRLVVATSVDRDVSCDPCFFCCVVPFGFVFANRMSPSLAACRSMLLVGLWLFVCIQEHVSSTVMKADL